MGGSTFTPVGEPYQNTEDLTPTSEEKSEDEFSDNVLEMQSQS